MERFSISVTLGKASDPHGANLAHNNRDFIAKNIRRDQMQNNYTFKQQDVREAYSELFGKAIEEYNAKQKQPCRRIKDYYSHIASGKREEPFYEVIVQLGDCKDTPCGSRRAEIAQKILAEYAATFQSRNPNLYVFNSVMHLDEASPHLHIDFVPFYSRDRQRGLSKGVSMRAALKEMGIVPQNAHANQLVTWEERERKRIEYLLQRRGHEREDKNAHHTHLTVDEFKELQDTKRFTAIFHDKLQGTKTDRDLESMAVQIAELSERNAALSRQRYSPYRSFFYPYPDKLAFVQEGLDREHIPYRETENGFEAQECYIETIRQIEAQFKFPPRTIRAKLRDDIDRLLMMSKDFEEFLKRLEAEHYEIKRGKYLAVKPADGTNNIRLKSLGKYYTEEMLRRRLRLKTEYETDLSQKVEATKREKKPAYEVLVVMKGYTIYVSKGYIPPRKKNPKGILTWENDAVLDKLTGLLAKINNGATLYSLRRDADLKQQELVDYKDRLQECDRYMKRFEDLLECAHIVLHDQPPVRFSHGEAQAMLKKEYPDGQKWNCQEFEQRLENAKSYRQQTTDHIKQAEADLREAVDLLDTAEQVLGGTFLQNMAQQEMQLRQSANGSAASGSLSDGQTDADALQEPHRYVPRRR